MAQLELYISKSQRGYTNLLSINPTRHVERHVHGFGSALNIIDYDPSAGDVFYLVMHIEAGLLLTVICPFVGVEGEHYSASLFIPGGVKLPFKTLEDLLDVISTAISSGSDPSGATVDELRRLLEPDLPVAADYPHIPINRGHSYAMTRFGGGEAPSLADYAREHFYQEDYKRYAGVLMVSAHSSAVAAENTRDITPARLQHMVAVQPPKPSATDFHPYIGQWAFTTPLMVAKGSELTLQWRRSGFDAVEQKVTVTSADTVIPPVDTHAAKKVISPSAFYITEQGAQRLVGACTIKVNDKEINGPVAFTYAELENAKVEISVPGYFAFSGHLDLASTTQALIQMRTLDKTYRFDLPAVGTMSGENIRIHIKSKEPIKSCPIEGYVVDGDRIVDGSGRINRLVYVGDSGRRMSLRLRIVVWLACFVAGLVVGYFCFHKSVPAPVAPAVEAESAAPAAAVAPVDTPVVEPTPAPAPEPDYQAAVAYLDNNSTWERAQMEAIPELAGLFDDLNDYNFDRIRNYWAPLLADSRSFAAVDRAALGAASKRNPRTGHHQPTFVPASDNSINWLAYTYWIDP